jgi:hypothetical protein
MRNVGSIFSAAFAFDVYTKDHRRDGRVLWIVVGTGIVTAAVATLDDGAGFLFVLLAGVEAELAMEPLRRLAVAAHG